MKRVYWVLCSIVVLLCGLFGSFVVRSAHAQEKPFILPLALPPGPSTWLMGQPYGNTIGAFVRGSDWYEAGQRLHFGIDLSMPCGTPLVAVGAGEVVAVDDLGFGSGPHNLLIRHADVGRVSLYGHLLERPNLFNGQFVEQGQEVALSGDPDLTCDSRPHLHLEIRSLDYFTAYNPVDTIQADWHTLSLVGSFRIPVFQQDLDNARQWMSIDDQPSVAFGGRALNNYAAPYPDTRGGSPPANPPLAREAVTPSESWSARRLAFDGCCSGAWWHPTDADRLYTIDGSTNQRAAIFQWDAESGALLDLIGEAPPPLLSPDGTHEIARSGDQTRIRRLTDGSEWIVDTNGTLPALSIDNAQVLWQFEGLVPLPNETSPTNQVYVSNLDGTNLRMIAAESGLSALWLDGTRILLSRRDQITTTLGIFDTATNSANVLGAWTWMRGLTVAPGGGRLMFYLVNQGDSALNGVYTLETQLTGSEAQHLDWFGSWRWADADTVFYIPFDGAIALTQSRSRHSLYQYHVTTGDNRLLIDDMFTIANGDWSVSADGRRIAFWNADDLTTWLVEPGR